jgi:hypothetical protein
VAKKQQLNSLDRYRKRSPNLVLEQHSHCEVPAGCGGVVLRWRNPHAARPVRVHVYTSGKAECWIDGEPLTHGRIDLPPGRHVLAVAVERGERARLLRAALLHDPEDSKDHGPDGVEVPIRVLSSADRSWKVTLTAPPELWQAPEFDDSGWEAMTACTIPEVRWDAPGAYQWRSCEDAKATGLGVSSLPAGEGQHGPAWVRKVFEVPTPRVR